MTPYLKFSGAVFSLRIVVAAALMLLTGGHHCFASILYVVNSQEGEFARIDVSNGSVELIGNIEGSISGLAFDSAGDLFGIRRTDSSSQLLSIDRATAASAVIGDLGMFVDGLAFDGNDTLFGIGDGLLVTIDSTNAAVSMARQLTVDIPFTPIVPGIAFGNDGTLFGFHLPTGVMLTIDTTTGAGTSFGPFNFQNTARIRDLAGGPLGQFLSIDEEGRLVSIDTSTGIMSPFGDSFGFQAPGGVAMFPQAEAGLVGDYNMDGVVDSADYTVWRDMLGQTGPNLAADGNGNDAVESGDYTVWRTHFGNSIAMLRDTPLGSVPEPSSLLLVISFMAIAGINRMRN